VGLYGATGIGVGRKQRAGQAMRRSITFAEQCRFVLGSVMALTLCAAASGEPSREDVSHAVWRQQEISFVYQGYITRYSCDALQLKVQQVLAALAVHDSTTIRPTGCSMIGATSQIASMQISVVSAAALTEETRAEIAARSGQQELLNMLGVRQELGQQFPAQWREIDVARQLKFEAGDCEFLRQFGDQVLSRLAVKVIAAEGPCATAPPRFKQARLKIQALTPIDIDGRIGQLR